jgi:FMN phosphatase YigB (HAD superfamily)
MGIFRPLPDQRLGVRTHLSAALERLCDLGALNVITTFATDQEAGDAVELARIADYIHRIYSHNQMFSVDSGGLSKNYEIVLNDLSVDASSIIAVGDHLGRDIPKNGMVFVYEPDAMEYSAHVTRIIIETLASTHDDFRQAFDLLAKASQLKHTKDPRFTANFYVHQSPVIEVVEYESNPG